MTRLRILSDLHLDTPNLQNIAAINQGYEDIVVCAGDVMNNPTGGIRWLRSRFPFARRAATAPYLAGRVKQAEWKPPNRSRAN